MPPQDDGTGATGHKPRQWDLVEIALSEKYKDAVNMSDATWDILCDEALGRKRNWRKGSKGYDRSE